MNGLPPPTYESMDAPGEFAPRYRVTAPLVIAKDQGGRLHYCYQGTLLGWLNDEQRGHFLRKGLIEEIGDRAAVPEIPSVDAITECVAALAQLGVPLKAGGPAARKALRDAGHKISNGVVAAAVRERKLSLARQTSDDDEGFEEVVM
jgi:hypothetical protein